MKFFIKELADTFVAFLDEELSKQVKKAKKRLTADSSLATKKRKQK